MKKLYFLIICAVLLTCGACDACTLFAATGSAYVKNGGTLISKTRDWTPQYNGAKLYTLHGENTFYAIIAGDTKDSMSPRGGINDKGLAIVVASASSVPKDVLRKIPRKGNITQDILSACNSVEEAVKNINGYRGQFVLLADREEIALVEISPEGIPDVKRIKSGYLYHTNHYVCDDFVKYNAKLGESSRTRFDRIGSLLTESAKPFSIDDFTSFTDDRHDGPVNSIWRVGDARHSIKTQAAFTVHISPDGDAEIFLKICKDPLFPKEFETIKIKSSEIFCSVNK